MRRTDNYASDVAAFADFPGRPVDEQRHVDEQHHAAVGSQLLTGRAPNIEKAVKQVRVALGPCDCGEPADRPMFAGAICDPCYDELVERVAARQMLRGWGRRVEPSTTDPEIRSRFPGSYRDLRCVSCTATWYGPPGEPCPWCIEALERMRQHQADLLLTPELPDVDDARCAAAVKAWAERLARGVEAGIVTEHEARQALHHRGVHRVAA